ncbi:MAG: citramalate synthase, partial [Verrucomicrobia bacterium]|nr:citramalate synthase [Verrucomicrobiota bacterium]
MYPKQIMIYDTTLRDGTQAEGISFSVHDKVRIAEKLDVFGVHYIEGGWPGSNPKDIAFFDAAKRLKWRNARICAFGSTCRAKIGPSADPQIALLLSAETPAVTVVGKSWRLHVEQILGVSLEENRRMIRESVAYLKSRGREVIFDAEHFFDGYKDDSRHAMGSLEAAVEGGADVIVLCDTNGGAMVYEVSDITSS